MATLDEALTLPCGAVVPNRLAKAAMTEGLADPVNRATERHARLYGRWAQGGLGLSITGNVMIDRRHLERPGNVVIEDRMGARQLEAWATAAKVQGGHVWMQINHPGRQTPKYVTDQPVSASDVLLDLGGNFARPRPLKEPEIEDLVDRWGFVARVARETGFTGVQVHAAHGYLINQFLSPITNKRADHYGGALANRARLLLDVVRNVRRTVGDDFPVSVKLNSADFQKGGFTAEDCHQVVRWLVEAGIDLLEISGGTYEQPRMSGMVGDAATHLDALPESTRRREAYFLNYANEIRKIVQIPLMVTGGFRTRSGMTEALTSGDVDVIGLARPLCVETGLPGGLLSGAVAAAPSVERHLRLGPGLFGPNSPIRLFKTINGFGQLAWFSQQIKRLADGLEPDRALGLWSALRAYQAEELAAARAIRRPLS